MGRDFMKKPFSRQMIFHAVIAEGPLARPPPVITEPRARRPPCFLELFPLRASRVSLVPNPDLPKPVVSARPEAPFAINRSFLRRKARVANGYRIPRAPL